MPIQFVNIHTHNNLGDGIELVNIDKFDSEPNLQFISAGVHPWKIGQCNHLQVMKIIEEWCSSARLAAIGEIGLDRSIETDIETQKNIFSEQLMLANRYQLPVVIHCVRAYSDFLQILNRKQNVQFIFHGFNGNATIAQQLIAKGAMLSFGAKLFVDSNLQSVFAEIPNDCIFLETDTQQVSISNIYKLAASIKNVSIEELKQVIYSNLTRIFGEKWIAVG